MSKKRRSEKLQGTCAIAKTPDEIEAHFAIRKAIFVHEQRMFIESDVDGFDKKAIPLICRIADKIVGTVRVYPLSNATWVGGRLAVLKDFRVYNVGPLLVKEAVRTVKKQGGTEFFAYIQPQNVRFFKRLGWEPTGKEVDIKGMCHYEMRAILSQEE